MPRTLNRAYIATCSFIRRPSGARIRVRRRRHPCFPRWSCPCAVTASGHPAPSCAGIRRNCCGLPGVAQPANAGTVAGQEVRMRTVRVLLAEDHAVVREGTRKIVEADPSIEVVGEAADGVEAGALAARGRPDVVPLDLRMPNINGIEATRRMVADRPDARILILSAYDEEDYVSAALDAGASGDLLKSAHGHEVVAAIHAVAQGQGVRDARVARRALRRRGRAAGGGAARPGAEGGRPAGGGRAGRG